MTSCPTEDQLFALFTGKLEEPALQRLCEHLAACAACSAVLHAAQGGRPQVPLSAGSRIGRYRLLRLLGAGGMGEVYQARDDSIGRDVAIKLLQSWLAPRPEHRARLRTEALAANRVGHPGLVEVYELDQLPDGRPYLVMQYLDGVSLDARLARCRGDRQAQRVLLRQIASALAAAHHKGIIHRDLKPENIMVIADPDLPGGERIKVLDFGMAKLAEAAQGDPALRTQPGTLLGTPRYLSPEQIRAPAQVGAPADVYSLGVMLYEQLADRPLFPVAGMTAWIASHLYMTPASLPPGEGLAPLVLRMLDKDPARRPTMTEVAAALGVEPGKAGAAAPPEPLSGYDPSYYVAPPREERMALLRLARPAATVVVVEGPALFGKTSFLAHLVAQARPGHVAFRLDLRRLLREHGEDFTDLPRLLRRCAQVLLRQALGGSAERSLSALFTRAGTAQSALTDLLERHLLPRGEPVFLIIEHADVVDGRPYQDEFFALLRGWIEPKEGWQRLRLLLSLSSDPLRLEHVDHSSFFLAARPLRLGELSSAQIQALSLRHDLAPKDAEITRLMACCGGHPYLVRLALHEAAALSQALEAVDLGAVCADHLEWQRRYVEQHGLMSAVRHLLAGEAVLPEATAIALYRRGLVVEAGSRYRLRLPLYRDYFAGR